MRTVIKKGVLFQVSEGPFRYQAWPTVCRDEAGVLYAVCSGMRIGHVCPFGKNLMFVSRNGGETWSPPIVINDTWLDDRDAGICYLGNGTLLASYFNHPAELYYNNYKSWIESAADSFSRGMTVGALSAYPEYTKEMNHAGSFVRVSYDRGFTWGKAVQSPVSSPHGPIAGRDGRLLWLGKEMYSDLPEEMRGRIMLAESKDFGKNWNILSEVPLPDGISCKNLHEPHLTELPGGRLVGAIRAEGGNIPVPGGTVYTCFSDDGGKHFSVPKPTGLFGLPPHLLLLSNGWILCTYGRRVEPFGIRAAISRDGGEHFGEETVIEEFSKLDYAGDLGYPATVELDDGSLVTVYYGIAEGDTKPSILYTKWKYEA